MDALSQAFSHASPEIAATLEAGTAEKIRKLELADEGLRKKARTAA